jgi:hypothetical protein
LLTAKRRNVSILRPQVEELLTLTQISVTLPNEMLTGLLKNTLKDVRRSVGSKASGCEEWAPGSKYIQQSNVLHFCKKSRC